MGRGDLSDEECAFVGPLLSSERERWARPSGDNRRFLNGMLHVLRVGCPWRDMHERYGKWNSVYVRFRRWAEQGVWDALLQTLVELGLTDDRRHLIDGTTVRGHVSAAGGKGGAYANAFGRSRRSRRKRRGRFPKPSGFTSKIHARCENQGLPIGFILTGGEASDYTAADDLMALPLPSPKGLLGDKGYDGDRFRENLLMSYIGRATSEIAKAKTGTLKGGVSRFTTQGLLRAVEGRLAGNPDQTDAKPIQCACGAILIKNPHSVSTSQTRTSRVRHQSAHLMGRYGAAPRSKG